jgi:hypothetical protein
VSTTLDREEKRVIEAGKEEWRQRTGSSVLDPMQVRRSPGPCSGSCGRDFFCSRPLNLGPLRHNMGSQLYRDQKTSKTEPEGSLRGGGSVNHVG